MKRLPLPDLLKGFAVFLIVPVHILELFIVYPGRESWFGKTLLFLGGPVAVPVFMIIMGYFVAKNNKTFSQNFLRGVKVFVVGFLLNIGLNFHLLLKIKFAGWPYHPLEYIFGVDILYLAGLSIIVLGAIKTLQGNGAILSVVLAFAILALTSLMNEKLMLTERNYILPFIAGTYSWSYFPLFPWLAYPLFGFAFYFWEEKISSFFKTNKIVAGILIALISGAVLYFGKYGFSVTINLPEYYHHEFWFAIWTLGIVVIWTVLWRYIILRFEATSVGNFVMWMGKNITLFYIIQWLIIGNIATAIYQTQSIKNYLYWFFGIFMITVFLTWLIGKTNIKLAR